MLIRPAKIEDLESLLQLAKESGPGMTNLNDNVESMLGKLEHTVSSFSSDIDEPGDEFYFFVLEDPKTTRIAGCCGIYSTVGIHRPFYAFRVLNLTHTSQELEYYEPVRVLQMVEEHRGCAEIVSLFLAPDYRKDGNGKLLSRSRFLFMAEFINRFPEFVIAEMRGKVDENGQSAFWDSLGGHFFPMNFIEADQFNALGHFQFIADMMPKNPIYIRLLPENAQAMIGATHEQTTPALKMLEREGFRTDGCVDVFDAGPLIKCPVSEIRTVENCQSVLIKQIETVDDETLYLACNTELENFKLSTGKLKQLDDGEIIIDTALADILQLSVGDWVRYINL